MKISAYFTHYLLTELRQGRSLYLAFLEAKETLADLIPGLLRYQLYGDQTPQLEDNGNSVGNEITDGLKAAHRGFGFGDSGVTFGNEDGSLFATPLLVPPLITDVPPIPVFGGGTGTVTAYVADDGSEQIAVWAQIFPPSSQLPEDTGRLVLPDAAELILEEQPAGSGQYVAQYDFVEAGEYHIVIFAEDGDQMLANPVTTTVTTTQSVLSVFLQRLDAEPMLGVMPLVALISLLLIAGTVRLKKKKKA